MPPCTDLTPIQLFAAATTVDSDVPAGAADARGMNAIKIATRSMAIN
ncbi:hypothetical protein [Methanosarcina barkeri]|nr:hypothetical protein [Methanosarcina barkeri]